MDRPTRIVAIPGERLPRCCEYGAFPARSARPPSLLGGRGQGDTASDRRVLGSGGHGARAVGAAGAARIADASPAAYATKGPRGSWRPAAPARPARPVGWSQTGRGGTHRGARRLRQPEGLASLAGTAGGAGVVRRSGCPPRSPPLLPPPGLSRRRARPACRARSRGGGWPAGRLGSTMLEDKQRRAGRQGDRVGLRPGEEAGARCVEMSRAWAP